MRTPFPGVIPCEAFDANLKFECTIAEDGAFTNCRTLEAPRRLDTSPFIAWLRQWHGSPARRKDTGEPIPTEYVVPLRFHENPDAGTRRCPEKQKESRDGGEEFEEVFS